MDALQIRSTRWEALIDAEAAVLRYWLKHSSALRYNARLTGMVEALMDADAALILKLIEALIERLPPPANSHLLRGTRA